jgi:hypothetical protein
MPNRNLYIAVILTVEALVIVLALTTHSLGSFIPWKTVAILLIIASVALVRALTGAPGRDKGSKFM